MYQKPVLSFAQVQVSMGAMIERAKQLAIPVAIAIVNTSNHSPGSARQSRRIRQDDGRFIYQIGIARRRVHEN